MLDRVLYLIKKIIPMPVFDFFAPLYHSSLAWFGALVYGFPSRKLTVIGVTGTKGKSTVVYLISKILEANGQSVAACGSLGLKIKDQEWPNTLKMTMPGRFKLHRLMGQAVRAGCKFFVMEVTSEGIAQKRHLGIAFNCAVFTNLHPEHIESHGSFENYYKAKQELFQRARRIHVINADDSRADLFSHFPAERKIFYGRRGEMKFTHEEVSIDRINFQIYGQPVVVKLGGLFNVYNVTAALATVAMYGLDVPSSLPALAQIDGLPGRMQFIQREPFDVIVDYAHTPDSLRAVYETLKAETQKRGSRLICVLGAAGGGRDKWKRPEFGKIAAELCDQIILANEDPYDEDPEKILDDIISGFPASHSYQRIIDRRQAIAQALTSAQKEDIVVVTGKGSEVTLAVSAGRKIPWAEAQIVREELSKLPA